MTTSRKPTDKDLGWKGIIKVLLGKLLEAHADANILSQFGKQMRTVIPNVLTERFEGAHATAPEPELLGMRITDLNRSRVNEERYLILKEKIRLEARDVVMLQPLPEELATTEQLLIVTSCTSGAAQNQRRWTSNSTRLLCKTKSEKHDRYLNNFSPATPSYRVR
jgi:hypothetical protein